MSQSAARWQLRAFNPSGCGCGSGSPPKRRGRPCSARPRSIRVCLGRFRVSSAFFSPAFYFLPTPGRTGPTNPHLGNLATFLTFRTSHHRHDHVAVVENTNSAGACRCAFCFVRPAYPRHTPVCSADLAHAYVPGTLAPGTQHKDMRGVLRVAEKVPHLFLEQQHRRFPLGPGKSRQPRRVCQCVSVSMCQLSVSDRNPAMPEPASVSLPLPPPFPPPVPPPFQPPFTPSTRVSNSVRSQLNSGRCTESPLSPRHTRRAGSPSIGFTCSVPSAAYSDCHFPLARSAGTQPDLDVLDFRGHSPLAARFLMLLVTRRNSGTKTNAGP